MKPTLKSSIVLLAIVCTARPLRAATGTITPSPYQVVLDNAGNPVSAACVWTYTAGTSTPVATYSDVALATPNANPIIASVAGRFTAFLAPGSSYKFIYENTPCNSGSHGATLVTADNIAATPTSAANVDTTGTAGEAISAAQCVYLSDGSGSKTAGQWFKCDSASDYSSILNEVGMAPSAISNGATGTIRITGVVTGLSSLTVGAEYFVGSSGAITSTAPTLRRHLGHADTATTLVLTGNPPPTSAPVNLSRCALRLTLESGVPVSKTDQTAKTSVFVTPVDGGQCAFYNGAAWTELTNAEVTVSVPATTSTPFDVFCRTSSGTIACDTTTWTNDTTRATALTTQNGVRVKAGDATRRYIGTARTTTVSGQCEDSKTKRYVWSYYNRASRVLERLETTASWTYTTASTWRQANAAPANQVEVVVGWDDVRLDVMVAATMQTSTPVIAVGIGADSTTAPIGLVTANTGVTGGLPHVARLNTNPAVGRHFYAWLEWTGGATLTVYGKGGTGPTEQQSGITGSIEG